MLSSRGMAGPLTASLMLLAVVACLAVQMRATARAELLMRRTALGEAGSQLDAHEPSWWTKQLSSTAADVFWPHRKLLPTGKGTGLVLLNPGELSGELKDPDDPWGYSHPRWYVIQAQQPCPGALADDGMRDLLQPWAAHLLELNQQPGRHKAPARNAAVQCCRGDSRPSAQEAGLGDVEPRRTEWIFEGP